MMKIKREAAELRNVSNKFFMYFTSEHMVEWLDTVMKTRLHELEIDAIEDALKQDDPKKFKNIEFH